MKTRGDVISLIEKDDLESIQALMAARGVEFVNQDLPNGAPLSSSRLPLTRFELRRLFWMPVPSLTGIATICRSTPLESEQVLMPYPFCWPTTQTQMWFATMGELRFTARPRWLGVRTLSNAWLRRVRISK